MGNLLLKKENDDLELQIRTIEEIKGRYERMVGCDIDNEHEDKVKVEDDHLIDKKVEENGIENNEDTSKSRY